MIDGVLDPTEVYRVHGETNCGDDDDDGDDGDDEEEGGEEEEGREKK